MNAAPASSPPTTPRMAAALRRIGLLPRRLSRRGLLRRGLLLRGGRLPRRRLPSDGLGLDAAQRRLEVVEDEPDRRVRAGRSGDCGLVVSDDEDARLAR